MNDMMLSFVGSGLRAWGGQMVQTLGISGSAAAIGGTVLLMALAARARTLLNSQKGLMATAAVTLVGVVGWGWSWPTPQAVKPPPMVLAAAPTPAPVDLEETAAPLLDAIELPEIEPLKVAAEPEPEAVAMTSYTPQPDLPPVMPEMPPMVAPLPPMPAARPGIHLPGGVAAGAMGGMSKAQTHQAAKPKPAKPGRAGQRQARGTASRPAAGGTSRPVAPRATVGTHGGDGTGLVTHSAHPPAAHHAASQQAVAAQHAAALQHAATQEAAQRQVMHEQMQQQQMLYHMHMQMGGGGQPNAGHPMGWGHPAAQPSGSHHGGHH